MDVLVTDKTGTLTEGRVTLAASMAPDGAAAEAPLLLGLLATEVDPASAGSAEAAGNPLDRALWEAPGHTGTRPSASGARGCCRSTTSGG
jgi:P-type Mg2+ transporter